MLQIRQLAIPAESTLAVQTRTAQMQDKVEQQHLKRLVLDYEQREEAEEMKGKIIDCTSKGYTLYDKVIRFAKVVVGE